MSNVKYLRVKGWNEFQHYKDRNPPWIKLSTHTFQNYEFGCLHDASKLLAICIWTLASRSKGGVIPADFEWIKRQGNLSGYVKLLHLEELINKGFLIDASNALADCKQSARPETETETETETEKKERAANKKNDANALLGFEAFWEKYNYKKDRKKSEAAFQVAIKKIKLEELLKSVDQYNAYCAATDTSKKFPQGWLNGERWQDDNTIPKETKNKTGDLNDDARKERGFYAKGAKEFGFNVI